MSNYYQWTLFLRHYQRSLSARDLLFLLVQGCSSSQYQWVPIAELLHTQLKNLTSATQWRSWSKSHHSWCYQSIRCHLHCSLHWCLALPNRCRSHLWSRDRLSCKRRKCFRLWFHWHRVVERTGIICTESPDSIPECLGKSHLANYQRLKPIKTIRRRLSHCLQRRPYR